MMIAPGTCRLPSLRLLATVIRSIQTPARSRSQLLTLRGLAVLPAGRCVQPT